MARITHTRWETPSGRYDVVLQQISIGEETKVINLVGLQGDQLGLLLSGASTSMDFHTKHKLSFAPNFQ